MIWNILKALEDTKMSYQGYVYRKNSPGPNCVWANSSTSLLLITIKI